jgi:2-C-methyl-D-erythritol 4-phosphate cytidylyltransferase
MGIREPRDYSRLSYFLAIKMKAVAIIVAAGEGRRFGSLEGKVYIPLCGRPMLLRALDKFCSARHIMQIIVVAAVSELPRCEAMLRGDPVLKDCPWVVQSGGATRQESVKRGLEKVDADVDVVAIHDGARPFVSAGLIERCVEAAYDRGAVAAGLPARDTIKFVSEDRWVQSTPDRSALWEIQTPQAFRKTLIIDAHAKAVAEALQATDDAMLLERTGTAVYLVEGERTNFKITFPEDLLIAEALIREGRVA